MFVRVADHAVVPPLQAAPAALGWSRRAPSLLGEGTVSPGLLAQPPRRPPGVEQVDEGLEDAEEPAGYGPDPDYVSDPVTPEPTPPLPADPAAEPGSAERDGDAEA